MPQNQLENGGYLIVGQISKTYPPPNDSSPGIVALQEVDLVAGEGEFVALFGPNGCGKSTLLHIVAGILTPDSGTVTIGGRTPTDAKTGFVLQDYRTSLFPWRTTLDNIAFPLELRGVPRSERHRLARATVDRFGLTLPLQQYPYQLSGGQQQLTAIARALIEKPDILLMDEPFSSLDYQTRIFMQQRLQHIWQTTGATVLFVSHEIDEALLLADRVVLLSERPASVMDIIPVGLERPREHTIVASLEFLELKRQIFDVLGETLYS